MKPKQVQNVRVQNPMIGNNLDIYWLPNNESDILGYNVYRDQAFTGAFTEKLNDVLIGVDFYRDILADKLLGVEWWYSVTAVNFVGEESDKSIPMSFNMVTSKRMKYFLQEFIRRHNIMLNWDGEDVDFLIRRKAGERCSCYDEISGQSSANCDLCYGTSYLGGYIHISEATLRVLWPQETIRLINEGYSLEAGPSAWVSTYPLLNSGDIAIRRNNRRYEIANALPQQTQGMLTRQVFNIKELDPSFFIYSFPVTSVVTWDILDSITPIGFQTTYNLIMQYRAPNYIVDNIVLRDPVIGSTSVFYAGVASVVDYDTELSYTVFELFKQQKLIRLRSLFPDNSFKPNTMVSIQQSENRMIYEIITRRLHKGYVAMPSEFLDQHRRWKQLAELKVGDKIAVVPTAIASSY